MTFKEFQATAAICADLGERLSFDTGQEQPVAGLIYADYLYIEDTRSWPVQTEGGRWHLLIERSEWRSDNRADLERRLYAYHLLDGGTDDGRLIEDALDAACKSIQDAIGQSDGGVAGQFFSGPSGKEIRGILREYVLSEAGSQL